MRLNWFSPLPPERTGIADYTAALLPELSRRAEVVLWTHQAKWDRALERHAEVRTYELGWRAFKGFNEGDLNIYHLGNNADFHSEIWETSKTVPGMVILHDLSLRHLFAKYYQDREAPQEFIQLMGRWHGPEAAAQAEAFFGAKIPFEEVSEAFTLCGPGVEQSLGVLVHSQMAFQGIQALGAFPAALANLPHEARPLSADTRRSWSKPPYRIILFGFIGPNRRVEQALQALGQTPGHEAFLVDIYGAVWDPGRLRACAAASGLEGRVSLHGFAPEEKLDEALAGAHLAINLRYPSMGEASASQLRIWEAALPTIVSRTGWYGELPEDLVAHVSPDQEIPQIKAHLEAFLADPERFRRMGEAGRRYLEERHAPAAYVADILEFAQICIAQAPRILALEAGFRAVRSNLSWVGSGDTPANLESLSAAVSDYAVQPMARPGQQEHKGDHTA